MEFIEFNRIAAEEWDSIVHNSPDGWAFSLAGWLEMVASVWKMENRSFAIRENGRLVAAMPLHWIPTEKRLSSSGWGHAGAMIVSNSSSKDRYRLWQACHLHSHDIAKKIGAKNITVSISPLNKSSLLNHWGVNPLIEAGFNDLSTQTRIIDLTKSEDDLWFSLAKDARQKIKHARNAGYRVQRCAWKEMLDTYYQVHAETYHRTGVKSHPKSYFSGIADQAPDSRVLWVGFDPNGAAIAFHNDARFESTSMYHTGCSQASHLDSGINYFLFWEAIIGAKADGCDWYESGEVFPQATSGKEKGLTDFKSKFGGELHRVFRARADIVSADFAGIDNQSPPSFTRLIRNWLSATRALMTRVLGQRFTDNVARILFWLLQGLMEFKQRFITNFIFPIYLKIFHPPIRFIKPFWGEQEREIGYSAFVGNGEEVFSRVEREFRRTLKLPQDSTVVLTSSGRTAIQLALLALKKKYPERTKVIIPTYGCKGTYDPIVNLGLTPVFVDVTSDLLLDSELAKDNFAPDVLACLVVHLCGVITDVKSLIQTAHAHGVAIIEDNCHATGEYRYSSESVRPDFGIYSFGMGKSLMASAGGVLTAYALKDEVLLESKNLQAEDASFAQRRFAYYYDLYYSPQKVLNASEDLMMTARMNPYNFFSMNRVDALILLEQLREMNTIVERRRVNAMIISEKLDQFPKIFFTQPSNNHLFTKLTVRLSDDAMVRKFKFHMEMRGIELEIMYTPLHLREFAESFRRDPLPVSEKVYSKVVNIPVRPNLTDKEVKRIAKAIESFGRRNHGF